MTFVPVGVLSVREGLSRFNTPPFFTFIPLWFLSLSLYSPSSLPVPMGLVPILSHTFGPFWLSFPFYPQFQTFAASISNSLKVSPTDSPYTALLGTRVLHRHYRSTRLPVSSIVFSHSILSLSLLACIIALVFNLVHTPFVDVLHYTPNQQWRRSLQDTVYISRYMCMIFRVGIGIGLLEARDEARRNVIASRVS